MEPRRYARVTTLYYRLLNEYRPIAYFVRKSSIYADEGQHFS